MEATTNESVPTKPCSICGKAIEQPKHRIHEATCLRNNYKCNQCGEIVAKSDKDSHELEMHTPVSRGLVKKERINSNWLNSLLVFEKLFGLPFLIDLMRVLSWLRLWEALDARTPLYLLCEATTLLLLWATRPRWQTLGAHWLLWVKDA